MGGFFCSDSSSRVVDGIIGFVFMFIGVLGLCHNCIRLVKVAIFEKREVHPL